MVSLIYIYILKIEEEEDFDLLIKQLAKSTEHEVHLLCLAPVYRERERDSSILLQHFVVLLSSLWTSSNTGG